MRVRAILTTAAVLVAFLVPSANAGAAESFDANAIFAQSKAKYAALHAYADTGTVTTIDRSPGAPALIEKYAFATAYVPPRKFLFDSKKASNGERIVVWANGGDFNSWWSATKEHDDYPQGQGATAFANASYPTHGTVLAISSLLFANAGLQSSLTGFTVARANGVEAVNGHPCYRIEGRIAIAYGTGTVAGAHAATLWIDKSSLMIRKLFEDTPEDSPGGGTDTATTTFDPVADGQIPPGRFNFAVPKN